MEIMRLRRLPEEEKMQIARRYLIPRQLSRPGSTTSRHVARRELHNLIRGYTREAGLRRLERPSEGLHVRSRCGSPKGNTEP